MRSSMKCGLGGIALVIEEPTRNCVDESEFLRLLNTLKQGGKT